VILALDAHKLALKEKTGTDTVLSSFVSHLNRDNCRDFSQIILYTKLPISRSELEELPANVTIKQINFPFLWTSLGLSMEMYLRPPDIFFSPSHLMPMRVPGKSCVIVHDVGFLDYPENYTQKDLFYLQQSVPRDLKRASLVLVPSEFTKKSIISHYYTDPNKIKVIHLGVDHSIFQPNHSQAKVNQTLNQYDPKISHYPFIFFLGRIDLRKNIINLIRAFAIFKRQTQQPHILILAGKPGVGYDKIMKVIDENKLDEDIIITNYMPREHLPVFYSEADLFLFPSLHEGFGIPILEAQACRTPVLTSNCSAMPEVAGEGALLVDPKQPDAIAENMKKIIENKSLAQQLVDRGQSNSQRYSWQKFTDESLRVLTALGKKL